MSSNGDRKAVVIGGSMAGLLAARVMTDYFEQVTVVERDLFPEQVGPRKGLPQARHIHGLLIRGLRILEELFPGFRAELEAAGAPVIDYTGDLAWFIQGRWLARFPSNLTGVACSRDLLEHQVRTRLSQDLRVRFLQGCEAVSLLSTEQDGWVTGVKIYNRGGSGAQGEGSPSLSADLVVDASGRASRSPQWLEQLGFQPPQETVVNAHLGYASRWYEAPSLPVDWKLLAVFGQAPHNPRSGVIFPIEGGRWIVTLGGTARDHPPTDKAGFLEFARSLASPALYEAVLAAQPVSPIYGYQTTENRKRHYDRLARLPEGLVVLGDAVCAFNPVYGQGMSTAAMGAQALGECLHQGGLSGLPARFQKILAKINALPWTMATGEDFRWPSTEGGRPGRASRLLNAYMDRILALSATQPDIKRAFMEVSQLISPVAALFRPGIAWRVLTMKAGEGVYELPSPGQPVFTPGRD